MSTVTIMEGNKMIAEFMGAIDETGYFQPSTIGKTKVPTGRLWMQEKFPNNMHLCIESELQYHTSFDWLMPVVEKICSMDEPHYSVRNEMNVGYCSFVVSDRQSRYLKEIYIREDSWIEAAWIACVYFITWYQKNK